MTDDLVRTVPETPEKKDSFDRQKLLDNLDATLLRLGDDPSGHPAEAPATAEESLIRTFSPKHQEAAFQELFSLLYPCLRPRIQDNDDATTAAAILMGPRGSGKSLLVERCLAACQYQAQSQTQKTAKFRKVMINGIVVRGEDVPSVVYEIIRQLSDIALQDGSETPALEAATQEQINVDSQRLDIVNEATEEDHKEDSQSKRRRLEQDEHLLRLRKSTFTSNLALLESSFRMAEVDRIPIVLILDEFDALMDQKGERQVLLYHLLDRVATPGSNLALVGLTSSFAALTQMEKRIRSRAEGTAKIIHVRPPSTYNQLREILCDKLSGSIVQKDIEEIFSVGKDFFLKRPSLDKARTEILSKISYTLQREFRMGRDVRWFTRVLLSAISLYRFDCLFDTSNDAPEFLPKFFMEALTMMGATSISDTPTVSTTKQESLCLVNGVAVDPRLQALLDMSQPQVSLVLAARRILTREAHREQAATAPLTLERMMQEYESFRKGIRTYNTATLKAAAYQLLDRGIFVPSLEHSGGGPLQYHISRSYQSLDPYSFSRLPLHFPMDMERELEEALKRNLLDCSTALKEWGKRSN